MSIRVRVEAVEAGAMFCPLRSVHRLLYVHFCCGSGSFIRGLHVVPLHGPVHRPKCLPRRVCVRRVQAVGHRQLHLQRSVGRASRPRWVTQSSDCKGRRSKVKSSGRSLLLSPLVEVGDFELLSGFSQTLKLFHL